MECVAEPDGTLREEEIQSRERICEKERDRAVRRDARGREAEPREGFREGERWKGESMAMSLRRRGPKNSPRPSSQRLLPIMILMSEINSVLCI